MVINSYNFNIGNIYKYHSISDNYHVKLSNMNNTNTLMIKVNVSVINLYVRNK